MNNITHYGITYKKSGDYFKVYLIPLWTELIPIDEKGKDGKIKYNKIERADPEFPIGLLNDSLVGKFGKEKIPKYNKKPITKLSIPKKGIYENENPNVPHLKYLFEALNYQKPNIILNNFNTLTGVFVYNPTGNKQTIKHQNLPEIVLDVEEAVAHSGGVNRQGSINYEFNSTSSEKGELELTIIHNGKNLGPNKLDFKFFKEKSGITYLHIPELDKINKEKGRTKEPFRFEIKGEDIALGYKELEYDFPEQKENFIIKLKFNDKK